MADLATPEARALRVLIAAAEALGLSVAESTTIEQVAAALAIALLAISHRTGTDLAISHRRAA